jgi:hypothetical protein
MRVCVCFPARSASTSCSRIIDAITQQAGSLRGSLESPLECTADVSESISSLVRAVQPVMCNAHQVDGPLLPEFVRMTAALAELFRTLDDSLRVSKAGAAPSGQASASQ